MGAIVKIVANPIHAQLIEPTPAVRRLVADILSFQRELGMGDSYRDTFFAFKTNSFPAGFVRLVYKRLKREGFTCKVSRKPAPAALGPARPKVDDFPDNPDYEYQYETVDNLVSLRGMIAQVATGGGKSRVFKIAASRIARNTLFITTRKSLMYQMHKACLDMPARFGTQLGMVGDGLWAPVKEGINFALIGTLASRLKKFDLSMEIEQAIQRNLEVIEKESVKRLKALKLPTNTTAIKNLDPKLKAEIQRVRDAVVGDNPLPEAALEKKLLAKQKAHEIKRRECIELLKGVEFLTIEEAHEVGSDSFFRVAQACSNAHYRLALTATPNMRQDEEANMRLMACTGPIGIVVTEKYLIDKGILATPYFRYVDPRRPDNGLTNRTAYASAYTKGIVEADARNKAALMEIKRAAGFGMTSMALVQRKAHGAAVVELATEMGLRVKFIFGDSKQEERQRELDRLGRGEIDLLIGTNILDVGVDVPAVGLIVNLGGGKVEVAIRQRYGRGLRRKPSGPNVAFILEFTDKYHPTLARHAFARRKIVEDTPGFREGIVSGAFNYEELGFTPVKSVA